MSEEIRGLRLLSGETVIGYVGVGEYYQPDDDKIFITKAILFAFGQNEQGQIMVQSGPLNILAKNVDNTYGDYIIYKSAIAFAFEPNDEVIAKYKSETSVIKVVSSIR